MDFVSIRIITDDVARLVDFYERVTGVTAVWANEDFAELPTASGTLAIASTRTVPLFAPGSAQSGGQPQGDHRIPRRRRGRLYEKLSGFVADFVTEPTTMPWGNRSLLFRDPDGNLVNVFTPVTPQARAKFGR